METNPVLKELKKWREKPVKVRVKYDRETRMYEGILKEIDSSWHNGIGNIYLEDNKEIRIINGRYVESICLLETIPEKYNHQ